MIKDEEFPQTVRLFFALGFDPVHQNALTQLLHELIHFYRKSHNIRWSKPENLHITVCFIGEVASNMLEPLIVNAQQKLRSLPAFDIQFTDLHLFPPTHHPHVLALGIKHSSHLFELAHALVEATTNTNLQLKRQDFLPHLTLGKFKSIPFKALEATLAKFNQQHIQIPTLDVREILLMQSKITPAGSQYDVLEKLHLRTVS